MQGLQGGGSVCLFELHASGKETTEGGKQDQLWILKTDASGTNKPVWVLVDEKHPWISAISSKITPLCSRILVYHSEAKYITLHFYVKVLSATYLHIKGGIRTKITKDFRLVIKRILYFSLKMKLWIDQKNTKQSLLSLSAHNKLPMSHNVPK